MNAVITGEMNNAFNRKLRAFFTEFYFFLEYAERKLKRKYGKGSEQPKAFKKATSEQFDGSFEVTPITQTCRSTPCPCGRETSIFSRQPRGTNCLWRRIETSY